MKRMIMRLLTRLLAVLLAVWMLAAPALAVPPSGQGQLALLREIAELIDDYALYPAGDRSLAGVTARALQNDPDLFMTIVDSWLANDKYGHFMDPERYDAAFGEPGGGTYGIGIQVDVSMPLGVYVDGFLPGGGAEESGMEIGAQIVFVDGVDIADEEYMEVRPLILGDRWTTVEIGYINPGSAEVIYEEIRRGPLNVDSVYGGLIEGTDIGYIAVDRFGSIADYFDFDYLYNAHLPAAGATSVIIDLRGNLGGILEVCYNMLNVMLLDEGYLLCRLVAPGEEEEFWSTGWDEEEMAQWDEMIWEPDVIVILVDENSASASEVFTGTLQAYGLATVVGDTTFGKAHSQYHLDLSSGDVLIITTYSVELYGIGNYDGVGIIPDHAVDVGVITGAEMGFSALYPDRALFPGSNMKSRIIGLQERLRILGFYRTEPSGVFDGYTLWALNRFQVSQGLRQTKFASVPALRALKQLADEAEAYEDLQLEYAIGLCRGQ